MARPNKRKAAGDDEPTNSEHMTSDILLQLQEAIGKLVRDANETKILQRDSAKRLEEITPTILRLNDDVSELKTIVEKAAPKDLSPTDRVSMLFLFNETCLLFVHSTKSKPSARNCTRR